MIPIYRAKKIDSDELVHGYLIEDNNEYMIIPKNIDGTLAIHLYKEIDQNTLAIHFPNMIDKNGKKVFASLGEGGIGGDDVIGMCRDCNGDELQGLHAPEHFKGIVRLYSETSMSVVIETTDRIAIGTEDWVKPIILEIGSALRWSDCRHEIEVIGIHKGEK